jgi:hypothetical protein
MKRSSSSCRPGIAACLPILAAFSLATALPAPSAATPVDSTTLSALAPRLTVGDVVFVRIPFKPFGEVATATRTWTNHVGIVVAAGADPSIAESRFPLSGTTTLSSFVARSDAGRVAVARLRDPLSPDEASAVARAAARRSGILYDTGFDLHSRRQFCSRFVHEVLQEATGTQVGNVETFSELLAKQPDANVRFWQLWYFGRIPWSRQTVTPASLLRSEALSMVFDGWIVAGASARAMGHA